MATLSTWHNSNPNSDPNFLSPDLHCSSSSMSTQSEQRFYDSSSTSFSDDDDTVVSDNRNTVTGDAGAVGIHNFSPCTDQSLNSITSLTPPRPIRTSMKLPLPLSPNFPNSNLTSGSNSNPPALLHVSFNQDFGCFAAGSDRGFRIYNCDPFCEIFRRDFDRGGGIGNVEMLFRCNILALVGGGPEPRFPANKVMIWDDHLGRCIGELSFRSEVRGIRLRRDRIVVVLEQKVLVYNFVDMKLLHQTETVTNPKGLCEVSQTANMVLACPGLQKGQVRIEHYSPKRTRFVMVHDSRIARLTLTLDGALLATASNKGTLIRVFNTGDGTMLQEVRRGADRAEIYSLAFSPDAHWLAVSSDKGTVHLFNLNVNSGTSSSDNPHAAIDDNTLASPSGSSFSFIKGVLPKYFSSEWSVAQFRLIEACPYIAAFGHQRNTMVMLGMDGSFYKCQFDPVKGGEMTQMEYHTFLKPDEPL